MIVRALDSPRGLRVEVLSIHRPTGYAHVRALRAGATAFETPAERLHKPE